MYLFRHEDTKLIVGRDVFVFALFTRDLYAAACADVEKALDHWLAKVPPEALQWASVGTNSDTFKPYTPAALRKCRAELDPVRAAKRGLGYFALTGGEDPQNPSFAFSFAGDNEPGGRIPDATCLVEIRWPSEYAEQHVEELVACVSEVASLVPFRSGYASPALSRGSWESTHLDEAGRQLIPLAFRHPGYDLPENGSTASFMPADKCRGARWLTLLGPALVAQLGDEAALRATLDARVAIQPAGDGLLLRAGERPEIGDVNRAELTPVLRSVAAAIEPVTFWNDWRSFGNLFGDDHDKVLRWERRHLD